MAVPTSGSLSQLAIAQEALYGTYGSGTITGPISLYDMINGGNTKGSGNSYPTVNQACTPNPVANGSDGELKYIGVPGSYPQTQTFYFNTSQAATVQDLAVGDTLYTNPALTTTVPERQGELFWDQYPTMQCWSWCQSAGNDATVIKTNASGVITYIDCAAF